MNWADVSECMKKLEVLDAIAQRIGFRAAREDETLAAYEHALARHVEGRERENPQPHR